MAVAGLDRVPAVPAVLEPTSPFRQVGAVPSASEAPRLPFTSRLRIGFRRLATCPRETGSTSSSACDRSERGPFGPIGHREIGPCLKRGCYGICFGPGARRGLTERPLVLLAATILGIGILVLVGYAAAGGFDSGSSNPQAASVQRACEQWVAGGNGPEIPLTKC